MLINRFHCASALLFTVLAVGTCSVMAGDLQSNSTTADFTRVHSIVLPHFEPELPVAAGRDEFLAVCVSCHSARYVTMQPLFAQRQWEETADKMVKVYGAQMDPGQRQSLVGYLVAIHGPDSATARSSDDDDFGATAVPKPEKHSEQAPALKLAENAPLRTEEVNRGEQLFRQDCAGCHGKAGNGYGWVAPVLLRKPKNLAAIRFSMPLLSQVLWNGKRGTAMPSWRGLAQTDLTALGAYVLSLHRTFSQPTPVSPESLKRGNEVFQQNCAQCHGALGDGKGPAGASLTPEPANFKLKQPDVAYILQVLSEGIPGTAMPSWKDQISESDRQALAGFVRSLFAGEDSTQP